MIGILLQDEKFPGVHIAFGDPYGSQTHANWKSRTHVDVLTRNCDVWIDRDQVIEKGHYQMDHLGLARKAFLAISYQGFQGFTTLERKSGK